MARPRRSARRTVRAIAGLTTALGLGLAGAGPAMAGGPTVSGIFWLDDGGGDPDSPDTGNGVFDASEDVVFERWFNVELLAGPLVVQSTAPDGNEVIPTPDRGQYSLMAPAAGTYRVRPVIAPTEAVAFQSESRYLLTQFDIGDEALDNDANPDTDVSAPITLPPDAVNVDIGLFRCPFRELLDDELPLGVLERNVVHVAGNRVFGGTWAPSPMQSPVLRAPLPGDQYMVTPGDYRVTLVSADFGPHHRVQEQPNEQWALRLFGQGDTDDELEHFWTSPVTQDLATTENWRYDVVTPRLIVTTPVKGVQVVHAQAFSPQRFPTANSVDPVCAVFDRLAPLDL